MKRIRELDWHLIREEAQTVGYLCLAILSTALFAADLVDPDPWWITQCLHFAGAVVYSWWYGYRVANRRWK